MITRCRRTGWSVPTLVGAVALGVLLGAAGDIIQASALVAASGDGSGALAVPGETPIASPAVDTFLGAIRTPFTDESF